MVKISTYICLYFNVCVRVRVRVRVHVRVEKTRTVHVRANTIFYCTPVRYKILLIILQHSTLMYVFHFTQDRKYSLTKSRQACVWFSTLSL